MAGISGGILFAGWFNPLPVSLIVIAGCAICIASAWGIRNWLEWRSIPKEILEKTNSGTAVQSCVDLIYSNGFAAIGWGTILEAA